MDVPPLLAGGADALRHGKQRARQTLAEEYRDNRRRRFTAAEPLIVPRTSGRSAQQIGILVDRLNESGQDQQKAPVARRIIGLRQQILPVVCNQRVIVVLARPIDSRKRLFMQQARQPLLLGDDAHQLHCELVVVTGDIGLIVHRRKLVLRGRGLIVLCLGGHAKRPKLPIKRVHIIGDAQADAAAVMIVKLLSLGRPGAQQRAAADFQIETLLVKRAVNQKIFLLRTDCRRNACNPRLPKRMQQPHRGRADSLHGAQQRRFLIERLAAVGAEGRRYVQRPIAHKSRRCRVPGGIAARFKCGAQTAGRKAGRIRFSSDQRLSGKNERRAVAQWFQKRVVLTGSDICKRLKPMGVVRRALLDSPFSHSFRNRLRDVKIKR